MSEKQKRVVGIAGAAMLGGCILMVLGEVWDWFDNIFVDMVALLFWVVVLVSIRSYRKLHKEREACGEPMGREVWSLNWKQLLCIGAMLAVIGFVTVIRYRATGSNFNFLTDVYLMGTIVVLPPVALILTRYYGCKEQDERGDS
jgi:L-asparagine transporter-like permease